MNAVRDRRHRRLCWRRPSRPRVTGWIVNYAAGQLRQRAIAYYPASLRSRRSATPPAHASPARGRHAEPAGERSDRRRRRAQAVPRDELRGLPRLRRQGRHGPDLTDTLLALRRDAASASTSPSSRAARKGMPEWGVTLAAAEASGNSSPISSRWAARVPARHGAGSGIEATCRRTGARTRGRRTSNGTRPRPLGLSSASLPGAVRAPARLSQGRRPGGARDCQRSGGD